MPTVVHGDFEWDEDKATTNLAKHGVAFGEAALAMRDRRSVDFEDLVEAEKLITLAASPAGRILYVVSTERGAASGSSAPARRHHENDDAMTKQSDPSPALAEMPEIDDVRFRRRPGRGHHADREVGEIVVIDADIWSHFGSADAVNDALRRIMAGKTATGS